MKLTIVGTVDNDINEKLLERVAQAAFSFLPLQEGLVELKFLPESEITKLNKEYRAKNMPTDVLTFQVTDNPLIGQIFICYNIAKKQAKILNKTPQEEVCLLLLHGILHLFGYGHNSPEDAEKMEKTETKILKGLEMKR